MKRRTRAKQSASKKRSAATSTTRAAVLAWQRRWRLVNAAEIAELRASPPDLRFRQMIAISELIRAIDPGQDDSSEEAIARDRWVKLKDAFLESTGNA